MKAQDLVVGAFYSDTEKPGIKLVYVGVLEGFYKGQHNFDAEKNPEGYPGSICNDAELAEFIRPYYKADYLS